MDQITAIDNKLKQIVTKLDEIRDLLIKHQKKELSTEGSIFEPLLKLPDHN